MSTNDLPIFFLSAVKSYISELRQIAVS